MPAIADDDWKCERCGAILDEYNDSSLCQRCAAAEGDDEDDE